MRSNINEIIEQYVIKTDNKDDIIIIPNETIVIITTDKTDFEEKIRGRVTFMNIDSIELNEDEIIKWEYIIDIELE